MWVAWRQQRATLLGLAAVAVALAAAMVYLRFDMQAFIHAHGPAPDPAQPYRFSDTYGEPAELMLFGMLLLPLLIGMFLGAPLFSREFEQHTHLLALSQSVGRTRWALVKLGVAAGASVLLLLVPLGAYTWMYRVAGHRMDIDDRFIRPVFEAQGLLPIMYTVFALVAGAGIGLLLGNTVAAIGATLAVFAIARFSVERIRPGRLDEHTQPGRVRRQGRPPRRAGRRRRADAL